MPAITYYPTKPLAPDKLINSQADLQTNFGAISSYVSVDHKAFTDGNAGKHDKVSLPVSALAPGSAVTEMVLYTKTVAGHSDLFYQRDAVTDEINITGATKATNGITMLPSGLILVWGEYNQSQPVNTSYTIPFHTAFPNHCYNAQITTFSNPSDIFLVTLTATTKTDMTLFFKIITAGLGNKPLHFYYFAIGD